MQLPFDRQAIRVALRDLGVKPVVQAQGLDYTENLYAQFETTAQQHGLQSPQEVLGWLRESFEVGYKVPYLLMRANTDPEEVVRIVLACYDHEPEFVLRDLKDPIGFVVNTAPQHVEQLVYRLHKVYFEQQLPIPPLSLLYRNIENNVLFANLGQEYMLKVFLHNINLVADHGQPLPH